MVASAVPREKFWPWLSAEPTKLETRATSKTEAGILSMGLLAWVFAMAGYLNVLAANAEENGEVWHHAFAPPVYTERSKPSEIASHYHSAVGLGGVSGNKRRRMDSSKM